MSNFNQIIEIEKINYDQQIVYGKVLVPERFDSQNDIVSKKDIEESAHNFLINLQKAYVELQTEGVSHTKPSQIGYMHKVFKGVGGLGYIVESYIDPEGSWVLGTKVTNKTVWEMIKSGQITGYSVGGKGRRIPLEGDDVNETKER